MKNNIETLTKPIRKICLLVGLPGSGKTTIGTQLTNKYKLEQKDVVFIDDIGKITGNAEELLIEIDKKNTYDVLIISDVFFCQKEILKKAIQLLIKLFPSYMIECLFFENNIKKCLNNVKKRSEQGDDRKVDELIKQLSKKYEIVESDWLSIHNCKSTNILINS